MGPVMQQFETRPILRDEVVRTFCNRCGLLVPDPYPLSDLDSHIVKLFATWGYGSPKDGEDHIAHMCESCYDEMIQTWVIPPTVTGKIDE